jgi:hypothetical protein
MLTRILKFFAGDSDLQYFIERNSPKNIKDIDNLCRMWIEQQQNRII